MREYFLKRAKGTQEEGDSHSYLVDSYMEELEESKLGDTRVIHVDDSEMAD